MAEVLEYVPARFRVVRHVRPKYTCSGCECMTQAAAPSRPIARSFAGSGLLAHVLVSKFCDHLPLYRQSQIYAREGVELDDSTLADWVGGCSRLLRPLVEALQQHVFAADKLHADDTPVPVLAPGKGRTKTGRLWTYVRDDRPAGDDTPPAVPQIGKASIHKPTSKTSAGFCKRMPMPVTANYTKAARFKKPRVGRMYGVSSTIYT